MSFNPQSIKISVLDLPWVYKKLKELSNDNEYKMKCDNLLNIRSTMYSGSRGKLNQDYFSALQDFMDSRIHRGLPILPDTQDNKYRIVYSSLRNANPKVERIVEKKLREKIQNYGYTTLVGIMNPSMYIDIVPTGEANEDVDTELNKVMNKVKVLIQGRNLVSENWVNIAFNGWFQRDGLSDLAQEFRLRVSKYFMTKKPALFERIDLAAFIRMMGVDRSLQIQYRYCKVKLRIKLDPQEIGIFTPESYAPGTLDRTVTCVMTWQGVVKVKESQKLEGCYYDIVCCGYSDPSQMKIEQLTLALAMYGGVVTVVDQLPYAESLIEYTTQQVQKAIMGVDHVWIAANKGTGKTTLMDIMPSDYLVIDSDVKGQLLHKLYEDDSLLKIAEKKDYLNPLLMDTLTELVVRSDVSCPSLYETEAMEFVTKRGLSLSDLLQQKVPPCTLR